MACLIDSPGVGRRPIHQGIERVYLRLFHSQSTSWVYIFIIKHFELGSQTRDQSDHLALAFFLVLKFTFFCVWKSSVLNSNSNVFGLLYSSYIYFEWVKIASLCQCFCVFIFLPCAAKNSACHLGISRLLLCRFRGHDMTNKEYALRRGVQWTFSIHSAYLLKNQSQNKKLSGSVWISNTASCLVQFGTSSTLVISNTASCLVQFGTSSTLVISNTASCLVLFYIWLVTCNSLCLALLSPSHMAGKKG